MRFPSWALATVGAASLIAGGALWTAGRRAREVPADLPALVAALAEARGGAPFEGRLVGQAEPAPISASMPRRLPRRFDFLLRMAGATAGPVPTAEELRGQAAALLFDDQPLSAVAALEQASRLGPPSAEVLSDLVVAYLAAARKQRPWFLARALGAAERARELAVNLPELASNRQLVVARLRLAGSPPAGAAPARTLLDALARWVPGPEETDADRLEGWRLFVEGHRLYNERSRAQAAAVLEVAREKLERSGSPLALWARYFVLLSGGSGSREVPAEDLARELDRLAARLEPGRDDLLSAYVHWSRGNFHSEAGRFEPAAAAFAAAAPAFEEAGLAEEAGFLGVLEAELHRFLGNPLAAWFPLERALAGVEAWSSPRRVRALYDECALSARQLGEPEAALVLQDRALELTEETAGPETLAEALTARAATLIELGRLGSARQDLDRAEGLLIQIADPLIRRRTWASWVAIRARVGADDDLQTALADLESAVAEQRRLEIRAYLPELELARGRLLEAAGDRPSAKAALESAARELEGAALGLSSSYERIRLAAQSREIYDGLIALALESGADDEALAQVERAILLELAPRRAGRSRARPFLAGARRSLAEGDVLVVYRLLPGRLLAWVLTSRDTWSVSAPVDREALERSTGALLSALASGAPAAEVAELSRPVWRDVWAPVEGRVAGASVVAVLADGALHRLPFAALVDPQSGEHLVTRHAFVKLAAVGRDRPAAPAGPGLPDRRSLLVVGDPAFDDQRFRYLRRLPQALEEAQAVAREVGGAVELHEEAATPPALLEALGESGAFYYAGHVQGNPERPERSILALSPPQDGGPSVLYAEDVESRDFPHLELVVLAACDSAGGGQEQSGPLLGFARAFLAAGAETVVASQWDVGTPPTEELLLPFYRALRHATPERALQAAQLALLRDRAAPSSPASWAAFEVFAATGRSD